MSKLVYNAAISQLRGEAQEALTMIEYLLGEGASPHGASHVQDIKEHARRLVEAEGALLTLQQYFGGRYQPPVSPQHAPPRADEPATVVTPEMSPTLRQALAAEEAREKRTQQESEK